MQDAWLRELRGKLLPRLRKFLFHPDFMTRRMMIPLLGLLGSLEAEPFSDPARRNQLANSPTNVSRVAASHHLLLPTTALHARTGRKVPSLFQELP